jgi:zinc transporter ZupT
LPQGGRGFASLAILGAFAAALVLFSGRSNTVELMRDPGVDERTALLDLRATAFAGVVLILVVLGAFLVEIAHGNDGAPYTWLAAVAGISYLAALLVLQRRS